MLISSVCELRILWKQHRGTPSTPTTPSHSATSPCTANAGAASASIRGIELQHGRIDKLGTRTAVSLKLRLVSLCAIILVLHQRSTNPELCTLPLGLAKLLPYRGDTAAREARVTRQSFAGQSKCVWSGHGAGQPLLGCGTVILQSDRERWRIRSDASLDELL